MLFRSYVIGRFVSELLTNVLSSVGFDNILSILGLPELSVNTADSPVLNAEGQPETRVQGAAKTPSEVAGLLALVGIVLFGAVTATEILQFEALTNIVQAIMRISAQVLSGLLVLDRKSTRLNSSHRCTSYAVFCLKKKKNTTTPSSFCSWF